MLNKDIEYVEYSGFVIPCYIYVEGSDKEEYWVDLQNAYFNFIDKEIDESTNKINGFNWWVITPHIPKNKKKINDSDVKWFVSDSSLNNDTNFEWDFEKHCAILTKSEIKKRISDFINSKLNDANNNNLKLIKSFVDTNGGKYIKTPSGEIEYLIGASSTDEDYYYITVNDDIKISFISCVGHIDVIELVNNGFSKLNDIIENNPDLIVEKVKNIIDNSCEVIFSGIYINGIKYD